MVGIAVKIGKKAAKDSHRTAFVGG